MGGLIKLREAEDKTDVNTTCVSDEGMIVKRSASKRHNKYVGELHVFNCIFMLIITLLRTFEQKEPFCKIALCFQTWCHLMIMQNKKNTTFLALLRLVCALEWTKK